MLDTMKKIGNNLIYILIGNAVYGVILYFFVTWLAGYSLLLAYLGNLVFIFVMVALDEYGIRKFMQPENLYATLQEIKDAKQRALNLRFIQWAMKHYMSFKTFLFVFYIAVLIFAQVLKFYPALAGEELTSFINIIEYSVIILLALKDFGEERTKDRSRVDARLEELDQYLAEHPDAETKG